MLDMSLDAAKSGSFLSPAITQAMGIASSGRDRAAALQRQGIEEAMKGNVSYSMQLMLAGGQAFSNTQKQLTLLSEQYKNASHGEQYDLRNVSAASIADRVSYAASSSRVRACSSWAIAAATDGWNESTAVSRSNASASSNWSATCWMPVAARPAPSTEAATCALTSSTLATIAPPCYRKNASKPTPMHVNRTGVRQVIAPTIGVRSTGPSPP